MASHTLILKEEKVNKHGLAPIYLRVIHNRRTKFQATGVRVKIDEWDSNKSIVKKKNPLHKDYNLKLENLLAKAKRTELELEQKGKVVNSTAILSNLDKSQSKSFTSYFEAYIKRLEESQSIGTYKKARTVLSNLSQYVNEKELSFADINVAFLKDYSHYLRAFKGLAVNSIHSNLKVVRKLYNDAEREDLIEHRDNPFHKYKLIREVSQKDFLTEDELTAFTEVPVQGGTKRAIHKDMFLFSALSGGLRSSDLLQLQWKDISGDHLNRVIYKTNKPHRYKLTKQGLRILEKYKQPEQFSTDYIFPILDSDKEYSASEMHSAINSNTVMMNKSLKAIARKAGIEKSISIHVARHTFGTLAVTKGMNVYAVKEILGHKSIETTMGYAKLVGAEIDASMDKFSECLT